MFLNNCYCHLGLTFGENDLLKNSGAGESVRSDSIVYVRMCHQDGGKTRWDVNVTFYTSLDDQLEAAVSKQR